MRIKKPKVIIKIPTSDELVVERRQAIQDELIKLGVGIDNSRYIRENPAWHLGHWIEDNGAQTTVKT